jgi:hypothetical protein
VNTRETVTVPREHIWRLLGTIVEQFQRTGRFRPTAGPALRYIWDSVVAAPKDGDTFTLDVEAVWRLQGASNAMYLYDLDECAEESYEHPAVKAECEVLGLMIEQAPATTDRLLEADTAELTASLVSPDAQTVTFDQEEEEGHS